MRMGYLVHICIWYKRFLYIISLSWQKQLHGLPVCTVQLSVASNRYHFRDKKTVVGTWPSNNPCVHYIMTCQTIISSSSARPYTKKDNDPKWRVGEQVMRVGVCTWHWLMFSLNGVFGCLSSLMIDIEAYSIYNQQSM